jgi:hypothetical protein
MPTPLPKLGIVGWASSPPVFSFFVYLLKYLAPSVSQSKIQNPKLVATSARGLEMLETSQQFYLIAAFVVVLGLTIFGFFMREGVVLCQVENDGLRLTR